ncbi:hypothetical protein VV01_21830 [Luteipulveratus halotolerans]|uniref:Putative Flp pilus-assembly TadG-like N-terminal domain-containing protein n=2 Tax=Luteipulveratus halotolerans TaxID=1631356 RepID=A0A0L6CE67_9MICO|nr:hypothetical protein VV01_21830 [Luteipulveratus halotolerans]
MRSIQARVERATRNPEAGVIAPWVAIAFGIIVLFGVGLTIDGSSKIQAQSKAQTSAQEAARAAGQQVGPDAVLGHSAGLTPDKAASAARAYLGQAGVAGAVSVSGSTVTVTTRVPWKPRFLSGVAGARDMTSTQVIDTRRVKDGVPR